MEIPGIGPVTATALNRRRNLIAAVGNESAFRRLGMKVLAVKRQMPPSDEADPYVDQIYRPTLEIEKPRVRTKDF